MNSLLDALWMRKWKSQAEPKLSRYMSRIPEDSSVLMAKTRDPVIGNSMCRDKFFKIRQSIKVTNGLDISEEKNNDPLWKVRRLINSSMRLCQDCVRSVWKSRWFPHSREPKYYRTENTCAVVNVEKPKLRHLLASTVGLVLGVIELN